MTSKPFIIGPEDLLLCASLSSACLRTIDVLIPRLGASTNSGEDQAASGPFCGHDAFLFQVGGDATPACLLLFLHRYNLDKAILLK